MRQLLSPKQVARSVGVSESSLKRWCDQGLIRTEKTPGGHRRIRLRDAIQFVRDRGDTILQPSLLGLPPKLDQAPASLRECVAPLLAALDSGDAVAARQIVLGRYLARIRLSEICDQLIAPVMHKLGEEWQCGRLEIYQERRACEVVNELIYELSNVAPQPAADAKIAIGGSPEGDQYRLATQMVGLALIEEGWQATSLGSSLPFDTLKAAVDRNRPRLVWLSVSSSEELDTVMPGLVEFASWLPDEVELAIGGQALTEEQVEELKDTFVCSSLVDLQRHARTL